MFRKDSKECEVGIEVANEKLGKFLDFEYPYLQVLQAVGKCSRCGKYFHLIVVADITVYLAAAAVCEIIKKLSPPIYTKGFL